MAVYSQQIQTALRLIAAKGMAVTFRKIANGEPDNILMPWRPGVSVNTDYPVSIAFFPVGRVKNEFSHYAQDAETSISSEVGYMGQQSFIPVIKDIVIRDGREMSIKNIERLAPNGEIILYILHFEH